MLDPTNIQNANSKKIHNIQHEFVGKRKLSTKSIRLVVLDLYE